MRTGNDAKDVFDRLSHPAGRHACLPRFFLNVGDRLLVRLDFLLGAVEIRHGFLALRRDLVALRRRLAGGEFAVESVDLTLQRRRERLRALESVAFRLDAIAPGGLVLGRLCRLGLAVDRSGRGGLCRRCRGRRWRRLRRSRIAFEGVVRVDLAARFDGLAFGLGLFRDGPQSLARGGTPHRHDDERGRGKRPSPESRERHMWLHDLILGPGRPRVKTTVTALRWTPLFGRAVPSPFRLEGCRAPVRGTGDRPRPHPADGRTYRARGRTTTGSRPDRARVPRLSHTPRPPLTCLRSLHAPWPG